MVSKIKKTDLRGRTSDQSQKGVPQHICSHVFIEHKPCHLSWSFLHYINRYQKDKYTEIIVLLNCTSCRTIWPCHTHDFEIAEFI